MPASSENEGPVPKQLTPTASWWFEVGGDAFLKVISLRDTLPGSGHGAPPPGWIARHDFYFLLKDLGELDALIGSSDVDAIVKCKSSSGNPDEITTCLEGEIDEVTDTQKYDYLMKGKSIVASGDWTAGGPPVTSSTNTRLFFQLKGTVEEESPRLVLELSSDDESIVRITWLTKKTHTGYETGFTLEQWSPPSSWTGWYYYSITP